MHSNLISNLSPAAPVSHDAGQSKNAKQDDWGIALTAEHFEITTRALRFYEDKGLLTPHRIGGRRVFNAEDRERLEKILRAKRIGFSLEDIKQFLDVTDGTVTEMNELLRRKTSFEAVITRLRRKRKDIQVVAKDMQDLCTIIDDHVENAPASSVFQFADAYDALFRKQLQEI